MFGKVARVAIVGPDGPCSNRVIDNALGVAERFEATVDRRNLQSELMYLCGADIGSYVPVSEWLWRLLQLANDISYRTDGLFDVAAAGTDGAAHWTDIDLSCHGMVRLRKRLFLSLGGLAKGFAVDMAIKALQEIGVQAGLVDIGGCIRAFGTREWRIEFAPSEKSANDTVPVPLRNDALAGCGSYFGHARLLDTQQCVTTSSQEWGGMNLLVRAQSCAVADALTKVAALKPQDGAQLLNQFGAEATVLTPAGTQQLRYVS